MSAPRVLVAALLMSGTCQAAELGTIDLGVTQVSLGVDGYADLRAVIPSDQTTWVDGGLGKLRYGGPSSDAGLHLGELFAEAHAQIGGSVLAIATLRVEPEQKTFFDVTEAYLRYRPVSLSSWRWQVKLGAFFPPISLENTDIGWASPWTITPSAINTWVGEELRTVGAEGRLEWRNEARTLAAVASIYGWNDPAGILVADRGWALHDRVTGLIERPRLPDAWAISRHLPVPQRTYEILEIDKRAGWYAGASWEENGLGRVEILRYDNEADPAATRIQVAWLTEFWSAAATTEIGNVVLMAQGMRGRTYIKPSPFFYSDTYFESAYLLAGWYVTEDIRLAARADVFSADEDRPGSSIHLSEHGHALTLAGNWLPNDWLRLTAEIAHVVSTRRQRLIVGLDPKQSETQFQLSAKVYF